MKQRQLINFRENPFVWLLLLFFTFAGLALLLGWLLSWEKAFQIIEPFLADQHFSNYTAKIIKQLGFPFMVFHLGLGMTGWIIFFSKPILADRDIIRAEKTEHSRFNLFIISSLLGLYLFGVYNIPDLITGLRLTVYLDKSLLNILSALSLFISGILCFQTMFYVRKENNARRKPGLFIFFSLLSLIFFLVAAWEINQSQEIFGLLPFKFLASEKSRLADVLRSILKPNDVLPFQKGITFVFLFVWFGFWLGIKENHPFKYSMTIPPAELFFLGLMLLLCSGYSREIFEPMAALFVLLYSAWTCNKWRVRIRNS